MTTPIRRRAATLAVGAAILATLASCSTLGPHGRSVAASTSQAPPGWQPSAADLADLRLAREVLIARCMAAGGHRYVVTADPGLDVPEPANPVVLDDVGWARQHGYGSRDQTRVREQTEADPNQRHVQSMPAAQREAYGRALLGSPTAGKLAVTLPNGLHLETADRSCLADADRRLYGDLPRWFASDSIASNLQPTVHDRLHRDPGFPPALTGWSACLATAGLRYATPTELQQATTQQVAGLPPEQAWAIETDHAAAEADCASRTGFGTFTRQLYHRYTQQVHAEYTGALQEQRQLRYHALITARPIVRHHPAGG